MQSTRIFTHKVFELFDFLLKPVYGNFVVFDDAGDLQFPDSVGERDQLGRAPEQTVARYAPHFVFHGLHVGFVVPRLAVQDDVRFGNQSRFWNLAKIFAFEKKFITEIFYIELESCYAYNKQ